MPSDPAVYTRPLLRLSANAARPENHAMKLGLVTYNWGKDWDLPTILKNLQLAGWGGVELRSTHKHGVETTLDASARKDVAKQFNDAGIELVGLGSACEYHSEDPSVVKKNIEETKAFIVLAHDCGGRGVKVRPTDYPDSMHYRWDNVLTVRTFSKAYGLAGIRIGYGMAHSDIIRK